MGLLAAGKTDIGLKRKSNQDAIYLDNENKIYIVADGMGGHNGGDIASAMAVKSIPEHMMARKEEAPEEVISNGIHEANSQIRQKGLENKQLQGMGTTTVCFYFKGDTVFIGNVGDSRAYLVNHQKLYQLTVDHSLVQQKLSWSLLGNLGSYSREDAQNDPQKNVIVRTVGFEDEIEVDVFSYKVSRNDILLLCTDGLHGKVCDEDIVSIINEHIANPQDATKADLERCVDHLVNQANENGGNDNISVILVLAQ